MDGRMDRRTESVNSIALCICADKNLNKDAIRIITRVYQITQTKGVLTIRENSYVSNELWYLYATTVFITGHSVNLVHYQAVLPTVFRILTLRFAS